MHIFEVLVLFLFVDHSLASLFILTFTNVMHSHGFNLCVGGYCIKTHVEYYGQFGASKINTF